MSRSKRCDLTIDELIGLIQLDIGDYEEFALRGAAGVIARDRPILILEVRAGRQAGLSEITRDLGYTEVARRDGNTIYFPKERYGGVQ